MNQDRILEHIRLYVTDKLGDDMSGHGMDHIDRVVRLAKELAASEKCDLFLVVVSAYLHDVLDDKLVSDVKKANEELELFLIKHEFTTNDVKKILEIIEQVSFSNNLGKETANLSIEAQIVQDADRLDAIGIARTFYYGGFAGHKIYDPTILPRKLQDKKEYRVNQTVINHFYEKLLLLPELLNTKRAKEIGQQRKQVMQTFLENFESEYLGRD